MTNYESLTNLCHRLPPLTSSFAPTGDKDNFSNPNLRDTLGPDFMKMKTSSELKRLKTTNGISKKRTKVSSAKKISAKLQKLRQSTADLKKISNHNANKFESSGLTLFRTDKNQS